MSATVQQFNFVQAGEDLISALEVAELRKRIR